MKLRRSFIVVGALALVVTAHFVTRERSRGETKRWTGTVVDRDDVAIRGARVTLLAGEDDELVPVGAPVTTDRRGRFLIDVPRDRSYVLMAEMDGFAPEYEDADPRRRVGLQLRPNRVMTGRVLALPDRTPVANATVVPQTWDDFGWRTAVKTDADGRYRLDRIHVDTTEFIVQSPAALPFVEEIAESSAQQIEHDFLIPPEPTIVGRVIDLESGVPVADASIVPLHMGGDMPYREIVRSGADGSFEITGSSTWNGVGIEVRKDGYACSRREFDDPSWVEISSGTVTMGLLRECAIEGTIMDENGAPVANVTVAAAHGGLEDAASVPIQIPLGLRVAHYGANVAHSGADGRYRLGGLLPMIVDAAVSVSSWDFHTGGALPVFTAPGQTQRMDWTLPRVAWSSRAASPSTGRPSRRTCLGSANRSTGRSKAEKCTRRRRAASARSRFRGETRSCA